MATEDDNFDIDIYGDGGGFNANDQGDAKQEGDDLDLDIPEPEVQATTNDTTDTSTLQSSSTSKAQTEPLPSSNPTHHTLPSHTSHIPHSTNGDHIMSQEQLSTQDAMSAPHGIKRKDYEDRPTDPDATTALVISDLYWWTTDDDIRGWVNSAHAEDELKEVTFNEHKVNGKSKGQAFVEFTTTQAATATKHYLETASGLKHTAQYASAQMNPFKTHPKDALMRKDGSRGNAGFNSGGNQNMNFGGGNMNMGGFRGRGGYNNNRGVGNMGGFNNRNNFNNMGGFQGGNAPAAGGMMGGFQAGPMGMQNFGFNNRGGMMNNMRGGPGGMRGGRGGNMAGAGMMMPGMNPMGGMGMNPMAGGGMNPMMGNMGGNMGMQGFQGPNPAFNQNFFGGANQGGDGTWNPHGAKRSRQE